VAGLVHDGAFGFAGCGGESGQSGAQAVTGKIRRIIIQLFHIAFDDEGHPFRGQALRPGLVL